MNSCIYCGKPSGSRQVCPECHRYHKPGLYKKLGLTSGCLKERYEKAFQILYEEYFIQRMSVWAIYDKYKICCVTLQRLFLDHGIKLRTVGEGLKVGLIEGRVHRPEIKSKGFKYHHGWHISWDNKQVYYRSSYELEYAQFLDKERIVYEMESKRILYFDTQKGTQRVAIPDFYLPETNSLVEIKAYHTYDEQNMKDKFEAYRDSGYNPILILEKKQIEL